MLLRCYQSPCLEGNNALGWCLPSSTSPTSGLIYFELCILELILVHQIYLLILLCNACCLSAKNLAKCCACADKRLHDYSRMGHICAIFNLATQVTAEMQQAQILCGPGTAPLCQVPWRFVQFVLGSVLPHLHSFHSFFPTKPSSICIVVMFWIKQEKD